MKRILSRVLRHGMLFAAAKSTVLFAPLLAAAMLTASEYGSIEWWLSLSMILGPLAGFGSHAIAAYGSVGGTARRHVRTAVWIALMSSSILVGISVIAPAIGFGWRHSAVGPVCLQSAVVCLQMTLSARLKASGRGAWASLVESTIFASLLVSLSMTFLGLDFVYAYGALLFLSSILLAFGLARSVSLSRPPTWPARRYKASLAMGMTFLAGGLLMALFMALPRMLLGYGFSTEVVARFALVFRWLSISIAVHQFANTVFFRKLFGGPSHVERDRMFAGMLALVAVIAITIAGVLSSHYLEWLPRPKGLDMRVPWVMALAMVLWSATASLEGWLYRVGQAVAQSKAVVAGVVALLASLAALLESLRDPVLGMSIAVVVGFGVMVSCQVYFLFRAGIGTRYVLATSVGMTLAVSVICLHGGLG